MAEIRCISFFFFLSIQFIYLDFTLIRVNLIYFRSMLIYFQVIVIQMSSEYSHVDYIDFDSKLSVDGFSERNGFRQRFLTMIRYSVVRVAALSWRSLRLKDTKRAARDLA